MRYRPLATCVLPFLVVGSHASTADLDTILERNSAAHGGVAFERIDSVRVELLISEPTVEVRGTYLATRDGLMRMDIYAGANRVYAEGISPECAWSWSLNPRAGEPGGCVDDRKAAALRHSLELPGLFYTLRDVRDRGAAVELIGSVGTAAGPEWQLRGTLDDGFTQDYFIDQATNQVTRTRDYRAVQPTSDAAEVLIETRFESPIWIERVLHFERQVNVNVNTGEELGSTTVLELEFNPEISAETFKVFPNQEARTFDAN
ncbi:MAG: hypothetical protein V2I57_11605 [Xanthomonadales bacterium]|jgi:hypothetical protein|nr:hypothetical protein [Xanthomonadales bacterium]